MNLTIENCNRYSKAHAKGGRAKRVEIYRTGLLDASSRVQRELSPAYLAYKVGGVIPLEPSSRLPGI